MSTELEFSPTTAGLASDFIDMKLSHDDQAPEFDHLNQQSPAPPMSMASSPLAPSSLPVMLNHSRGESSSSVSSGIYSDASAPHRPTRSLLCKSRGADITCVPSPCGLSSALTPSMLLLEVEGLHAEVATLLDKIYEIEELRHSPSARSGHATRLDGLLSELNDSIEELGQRMSTFEIGPDSDPSGLLGPLRADWTKVLAQHVQLKQELQEDPWLIRFRTYVWFPWRCAI